MASAHRHGAPYRVGSMAVREQARLQGQHRALFAAARQLIPSLQGRLLDGLSGPLLAATAEQGVSPAAALHEHWRQTHPEAGAAYWLTRSWSMLCWQSIYLAVVAVYRVGAVPALDKMEQGYRAGLVSGFRLPLAPMIEGEVEVLIEAAARRLRSHWQGLFELFAREQRLRPGFIRPLLADDLLAALARVPDFFPEVSREQAAAHAPLWLAACGLPVEHLAGWRQTGDVSESPIYIRQRCCLHYKRRDGEPCGNCPRNSCHDEGRGDSAD